MFISFPRANLVASPSDSRLLKFVVTCLVAVAVILSTSHAEAQRRGRGRSAAAAAAARKKQMIASLQKRLAAARQVLAAAENQTRMSQSEVDQAVSKLSEIRTSMEAEEQEAAEAAKSLHEIEDTVLEKSSEFRAAENLLDTAKEDLHAILHKLAPKLGEPDDSDESCRLGDMARLSSEDRKRLEESKDYQSATETLHTQARTVAQLRQKLLQADPQWVATRKEAAELATKLRQERAQASTTGIGSLDDRKTLRTAQSVAAEARLAIMQCEAMLQRLGAKPAAPPKKSGSNK